LQWINRQSSLFFLAPQSHDWLRIPKERRMRVLIAVDASRASLAAVDHLSRLKRCGADIEALVLNVQPPLNRHISRFTSREARMALHAERSRAAVASAIDRLAAARVPFRLLVEIGPTAQCIAEVAERERVDEVIMGVGRHPEWLRWFNPSISRGVMARTDIPVTVLNRGQVSLLERYGIPAGVVGLAAWLIAAE
jgi:nucleotide-binding universal stress UspA family protein